MNFNVRPPLEMTTKLYRYMKFSQFVSLIEHKKFYLTKVSKWDDTWELPSSSIPIKKYTGELRYESKMGEKYLYGSSWTKLSDSDAMWRIYAPQRDGILIESTVKKFKNFAEFSNGYISEVFYYDDLREGFKKTMTDRDFWRPYSLGLIKRNAFVHEDEVRFLYYYNPVEKLHEEMEKNPFLVSQIENLPDYVYSSFDPLSFIEGITIDPRSEEWFVSMVINYVNRAGFKIEPKKSKLYSRDIYSETGVHFTEWQF